ncbi:hypothetical protein NEOLEDRAFT_1060281 [Neolentinus lepideus HHB14362 ss-1]|uniref:Uncharacterized protein n=1 Tax=Neolentinus lepideus HHB14362 ss-1 TaxID=1314782 RepID=A0A165U2L9_9AGAM|nr:hypothetical protein NEOLEDRAFT_1060281 [Neolentinus lepideus HHB14362 ss-1]
MHSMADVDMLRVWQLVHELAEQNVYNQNMAAKLIAQAGNLKNDAAHASTGFALQRVNTDITKEVFESELERMNAAIIIENQTLTHENKQLSQLLKEYEQTMDTVMQKFRGHAQAAQMHELTLTRHYETLILSRETHTLHTDLSANSTAAHSLQRLSETLRALMRSLQGEEPPQPQSQPQSQSNSQSDSPQPDSQNPPPEGEERDPSQSPPEHEPSDEDDLIPDYNWALERETEIARLEAENEYLRQLLSIDTASASSLGIKQQVDDELQRLKMPPPPSFFHPNSQQPPQPQEMFFVVPGEGGPRQQRRQGMFGSAGRGRGGGWDGEGRGRGVPVQQEGWAVGAPETGPMDFRW